MSYHIAALIRFNEREATVLFAPPLDPNGQWHEVASGTRKGRTHTLAEIVQALGGEAKMVVTE